MLRSVTWSSYWIAVLILLVIYYMCVLFIFRSSFKSIFVFGREAALPMHELTDSSESLSSLMEEARAYLAHSTTKGKDEVLYGLSRIVKKHNPDEDNAESMKAWMRDECNRICGLHLEEEDMRRVWIS